MIIGRNKEINKIKEALSSSKQEALLIYGRRRVGKTYLINHVLKDFKDYIIINYTFRDTLTSVNVEEFSKYVGELFNDEYFKSQNLSRILKYIDDKSKNKKVIIFLDEYSFLRKFDSGIDSYFQIFIDNHVDDNKYKFIFSGSYMDIMEEIIEKNNAPLFGRFSLILKLNPLDYFDSSMFFANKTNEEKFKFYATFGGIPFILTLLNSEESYEYNLKKYFLSIDSEIEREIKYYLNNEFAKDSNLKFVLELIGRGKHKYKDIANELKMYNESSNIAYSINKLIDLNLIKKEIHVNGEIKNSYYFLNDNLLDFYYTFLIPYNNIRLTIGEDNFYNFILEKLEKEYFPKKFEEVSKEFLLKLNKSEVGPFFYEIGTLRINSKENNTEFDIVSKKDNYFVDYECKYFNRKLNINDYENELEQINKSKFHFNEVQFISKLGVDNSFPKEIKNYTLEDFYNFKK